MKAYQLDTFEAEWGQLSGYVTSTPAEIDPGIAIQKIDWRISDADRAHAPVRSWRRFACTGPLAAIFVTLAISGASRLGPGLSSLHPNSGAIEVFFLTPPSVTAGLQGGAAAPLVTTPKVLHHKVTAAANSPMRPRTATEAVPTEHESGIAVAAQSAALPGESARGLGGASGSGTGDGAGLGNDSSGARAMYAPLPRIPDDLRQDAFESMAIAHFIVSSDGMVKVTLSKATRNPELNRIVLATLSEWRFFPAIKDGVAIESEFDVRIPISIQ